MLKFSELDSFFERCEEYEKNDQDILLGPIRSLYKSGDSELLSYLRQDCDSDELYDLIKTAIDRLNNNEMTRIGVTKGHIIPTEYPSRNVDLANWLNEWNSLYFDDLEESDKKYVLSFFFLIEGFAKYKADMREIEFLEDRAIISLYGETVKSNYNLINIDDSIELLELFPARIYDKLRDITIYIEIGNSLTSVLLKLMRAGLVTKLAVKGNGKKVFNGRYIKEYLCEAFERGNVFSFSRLISVPDITKLYSYKYKNQLCVSIKNNEMIFEELCEDFTVQGEGIRTQIIHLMFSICESGVLINHIDHEYIYYSLEEYEKRQRDSKMKIKGSAHKRIKTFKIDEARIPMDYPCKMLRHNKTKNEYEEVSVPFIFFVTDTFFYHKDLLEEYFAKII